MGEKANKCMLSFKGANDHIAGQLLHLLSNYCNIDSSWKLWTLTALLMFPVVFWLVLVFVGLCYLAFWVGFFFFLFLPPSPPPQTFSFTSRIGSWPVEVLNPNIYQYAVNAFKSSFLLLWKRHCSHLTLEILKMLGLSPEFSVQESYFWSLLNWGNFSIFLFLWAFHKGKYLGTQTAPLPSLHPCKTTAKKGVNSSTATTSGNFRVFCSVLEKFFIWGLLESVMPKIIC